MPFCLFLSCGCAILHCSSGELYGPCMHYRQPTATDRMKYVHATVLPITMILPRIRIPVVGIQLSGGYGLNILAYYFCCGVNPNDMFYAVVLQINTVLVIGVALLTIVAWKIIDVVSIQV